MLHKFISFIFSLIKHANHCCFPGLLQTLVLGFYWFCWPKTSCLIYYIVTFHCVICDNFDIWSFDDHSIILVFAYKNSTKLMKNFLEVVRLLNKPSKTVHQVVYHGVYSKQLYLHKYFHIFMLFIHKFYHKHFPSILRGLMEITDIFFH